MAIWLGLLIDNRTNKQLRVTCFQQHPYDDNGWISWEFGSYKGVELIAFVLFEQKVRQSWCVKVSWRVRMLVWSGLLVGPASCDRSCLAPVFPPAAVCLPPGLQGKKTRCGVLQCTLAYHGVPWYDLPWCDALIRPAKHRTIVSDCFVSYRVVSYCIVWWRWSRVG